MSLSPRGQQDWRAIGAASGMGCSVVASLLLCIGGGILLDKWLGTLPIFTLVGVGFGLAVSGYLLYQLAVMNLPKKQSVRSRESDRSDQSPSLDE
jgi:F0F1-type ATP synthase assembly protein I